MSEKAQNTISICNSLIVLTIIAFSSLVIGKYSFQWAPESLDPSQNIFSSKRAFKHWSRLSISVPNRHMSTANYNESYDYVFSEIQKYKEISDKNGLIEISIEEQRGEIYESKIAKLIQVERDCRNILVFVEKKNRTHSNNPPIMISAHIDGKNRGPAAYDDAAGISSMLELLNLIAESKNPPKNPIIFLFVGVEELGLQGSKLFLKYYNCTKSNTTGCFLDKFENNIASKYIKMSSSFLNIESLGPGMPLGIMQKGEGSAGTINALKNTKGLIFGTFADDVTKLGLITSTSDAVRFREFGFAGAELLFFGNPTKYHTKLDSISNDLKLDEYKTNNFYNYKSFPINHLQLLGNALTDFAFKYENNINDNEFNPKSVVAAIGISPFALVMEVDFAKMCGLTISLMTLFSIISSESIDNIFQILLALLFELLSWLITTLVLLVFGSIHFFVNSLVYARSTIFSFNYLLFCGIFIYYFILHLFTSPKSIESIRNISPLIYQRSLTLFNCLLVSILAYFNLDSSIMFVWQLFFTNVANLCTVFSLSLAFIANFAGFIYIDFTIFLLFTFMTKYTSMIPEAIGDLVPFAITSISILFITISFTPFIVKTKQIKKQNQNNENDKNDDERNKEKEDKKEVKNNDKDNKKNNEKKVKNEVKNNDKDNKKNNEKEVKNEVKNNDKDNKKNNEKYDNNDDKINKEKENINNDMTNNDDHQKNSNSKSIFMMFLLSIFLLIFPFFSQPPYNSSTYNIQGDLAHIIDPINGSYVSFSPIPKKRVFKGVSQFVDFQEKSIQTRQQFEMPLAKYDVFYRNATSNLPTFIKKWPIFTISVTNKTSEKSDKPNLRNVVVSVPEENQDLIAINLVVDCGSSPCLDSVNSIGNSNENREWKSWVENKEDLYVTNLELNDNFGFRHDLRVMPGFQPASFNFDVFGSKSIQMKVTFTWDKLTDEAEAFLEDFPDFIQPFGRMRSIVDTSLVNYTYI